MTRTPPWKRPKPKQSRTTLAPADKTRARRRAKRAGRRYPNLVDNMHAVQKKRARTRRTKRAR